MILPLQELAKHGWWTGYDLTWPGEGVDPGIFLGQRFDVPAVVPIWKALKGHYGLVYEIDDDAFSVDAANWLVAGTYAKDETAATISECAAIADVVTVTTQVLAEVMRQYNPDVRVLPNCVPASMLAMTRPRHERLTIGWAGGASHMRDMALIAQTWRDVIDETQARGHFVGCEYGNMLGRHGFDFTPWALDPRQYYMNIDFDIGIIPIADHPFARSKSAIKAVEYAALGIPVIASDCEAYRDFVVDGVTGFLVRTQAQWREAMLVLLKDTELRESMGAAARDRAAGFTMEGNWQRWDEVYSALLYEE